MRVVVTPLMALVSVIVLLAIALILTNVNMKDVKNTTEMVKNISESNSLILEESGVKEMAQLVSSNFTNETIPTDVAELRSEVIKLRNMLEPRNISQAFQPGQEYAVNQTNNPYEESKEGTIAGLPNITK